MIQLSPTPRIETDRLVLRAPAAGDWPHWRDFMSTDRARFVRDGDFDEGKVWRAFGHVIGHWVMRGWGTFAITAKGDDTPIGMAGPWFPAGWPEREIGWTIWSGAAEGRGFAHEAAVAARDHAFGTLGWDTAVSYVDARNTRSIALAERLGATLDDTAKAPASDRPCLVFRHPAGSSKGAA
ncbi:GNAT family N-acetyltransferase [Paracoccus sp. PARArs4]|uniref:GNAT family N-acetyltransferase n=1 Tax=Paracoccus sp. PARArs4 TaxID=2853442 RepID=UPI0024A65024|nr:GNAT family N-acetyltransferase [Paracoccus sp. PARArs4]